MVDIKSKRFTLLKRDDYQVDLEYNETFAIIHLPLVTTFNKSTFLDMVENIDKIEGFLLDQGYKSIWVAIDPKDTFIKKLAVKLKFDFRGSTEGLDVYERTN